MEYLLESTGRNVIQGLVDEFLEGGYNSCYIFGPIAQLGARLNGIEKAEGSNPSGSTIRSWQEY